MYSYHLVQWLLFFYCYCFLGWCIESTIVSFSQRHWVNRGFLQGPMLPIYGSGAIMVLVCTLPVKEHIALVYFFGMIGATILEYITGWAMEKILKVRYWDYSNEFLNLNGHICLKCSLFWGILSIFMTYIVHKPIEKLILSLPMLLAVILAVVLTVLFLIDFAQSAKTALDLAKLLEKMQAIHNEMETLASQLKENAIENLKERSEGALEMVETLKEKMPYTKIAEGILGEQSISERIQALQEEKRELLNRLGKKRMKLIRRHPSAISIHFKETFEEIREKVKENLK